MLKTLRKSSIVTGVVIVIVLAVLTFQVSAYLHAENHARRIYPSTSPVPQGLYESCSPVKGTFCLDRLKQMASAGFKLVVNYDQLHGNAKQQLVYAEQAHSLGMKVIWGMSDPVLWNGTELLHNYNDLATTCDCSDNKSLIQYIVRLVKDLPATWGYYIGDEVSADDYAKLKIFTDLIRQTDPSHPRLFIGTANTANPIASANSTILPFVDTAEVLGVDYYPVATNSLPINTTGDVASTVQSVADQAGKQTAMVLQTFSWGQSPSASWTCSPFPACSRFPTKKEMRQMHDLVLNNANPQFILWYSYFNIVESDNPSEHWANLVEAAEPNSLTQTPKASSEVHPVFTGLITVLDSYSVHLKVGSQRFSRKEK